MCYKFFLVVFSSISSLWGYNIAVFIPAMDAEEQAVQTLIESGRRYFCRLHDVSYFVLSEIPPDFEGEDVDWLSAGSTHSFKISHALQSHKEIFEGYEYIFVIDPKMQFVAPVGNEIFGDLIAVQTVYSTPKKPQYSPYIYGGRIKPLIELFKFSSKHGDETMSEEMFINRCFREKRPTRILTPSYAYPENWELEYSKKIIITQGSL